MVAIAAIDIRHQRLAFGDAHLLELASCAVRGFADLVADQVQFFLG